MKKTPYHLIALLGLAVVWSSFSSAQSVINDGPPYAINRVYPYITMTQAQLMEAQTLSDLDPHYKSSWVREYVSVEVSVSQQGKIVQATGTQANLSPAQKDLMANADVNTVISVKIHYIPQNNLTHNDVKEIDFSFTVEPEQDASYVGGPQAMQQYLREKAIANIPEGSFQGYALAAVTFTINADGEVVDAQLFESSKSEDIDQLLLQTIRQMPCWKPATYADGTKVAQQFALTVGNMENCMVNLLNITRD